MSLSRNIKECYELVWDEADGTFQVPPLACPYPIDNDDGSAAMCIANGNCGCDKKPNPASPSQ